MRKIAEYITVRDQKKIEKINILEKSIGKLRQEVKQKIDNQDEKTGMICAIIALIDNIYERIGNDESAKNGHYGITGFKKKHFTDKGSYLELKYVGKSGVTHTRKVNSPFLVKKLRNVLKDKNSDDFVFETNNKKITASDVNNFLSSYKITAKDIRGYHSNKIMNEKLKEYLNKNPIPEDANNKRELKKKIYNKALEETAKIIGHESATLKKHYLMPTITENL